MIKKVVKLKIWSWKSSIGDGQRKRFCVCLDFQFKVFYVSYFKLWEMKRWDNFIFNADPNEGIYINKTSKINNEKISKKKFLTVDQ